MRPHTWSPRAVVGHARRARELAEPLADVPLIRAGIAVALDRLDRLEKADADAGEREAHFRSALERLAWGLEQLGRLAETECDDGLPF